MESLATKHNVVLRLEEVCFSTESSTVPGGIAARFDDFVLQKCHINEVTIYALILTIYNNEKFTFVIFTLVN